MEITASTTSRVVRTGVVIPATLMMMARRFGKIHSYEEWLQPRLVENAPELLRSELPGRKKRIRSVHFCFTTDPFMYGYEEVSGLTLELLEELQRVAIPLLL